MDKSKHTMTQHLGDKKNHRAINYQFFKRLSIVATDLYELELVKPIIEHREPIIGGFFILQNANLRMLELYYSFFDKFCDVNNFEELNMDTESLCLSLAEENLGECNLLSKRAERIEKQSKDCRDDFRAYAKKKHFSPILDALYIRNMTRENQDCSKRSSDAPKCYTCVVNSNAVTVVKVKNISLAVNYLKNAL